MSRSLIFNYSTYNSTQKITLSQTKLFKNQFKQYPLFKIKKPIFSKEIAKILKKKKLGACVL